jgi:hypothetical protein
LGLQGTVADNLLGHAAVNGIKCMCFSMFQDAKCVLRRLCTQLIICDSTSQHVFMVLPQYESTIKSQKTKQDVEGISKAIVLK